jgi:hypothetical protein
VIIIDVELKKLFDEGTRYKGKIVMIDKEYTFCQIKHDSIGPELLGLPRDFINLRPNMRNLREKILGGENIFVTFKIIINPRRKTGLMAKEIKIENKNSNKERTLTKWERIMFYLKKTLKLLRGNT